MSWRPTSSTSGPGIVTPPFPLAIATIFTSGGDADAPAPFEDVTRLQADHVLAGRERVRRARHRLDRDASARDVRLCVPGEELHVLPGSVRPDGHVADAH